MRGTIFNILIPSRTDASQRLIQCRLEFCFRIQSQVWVLVPFQNYASFSGKFWGSVFYHQVKSSILQMVDSFTSERILDHLSHLHLHQNQQLRNTLLLCRFQWPKCKGLRVWDLVLRIWYLILGHSFNLSPHTVKAEWFTGLTLLCFWVYNFTLI